MNCKYAVSEIVETARRRSDPDPRLEAHLSHCASCAERWETETELASHLRRLRIRASMARSCAGSRDDLMRQFAARHWRLIHPAWGVALAAAAALLIVIATWRGPLVNTVKPARQAPPAMGAWLSSSAWSVELSTDTDFGQDDSYTPVPYAAPLAPGERLSVMRAELYPAALASLGVSLDPATLASNEPSTIQADVVVGEDGFPRAVRVARGEADGADF